MTLFGLPALNASSHLISLANERTEATAQSSTRTCCPILSVFMGDGVCLCMPAHVPKMNSVLVVLCVCFLFLLCLLQPIFCTSSFLQAHQVETQLGQTSLQESAVHERVQTSLSWKVCMWSRTASFQLSSSEQTAISSMVSDFVSGVCNVGRQSRFLMARHACLLNGWRAR